MKKTLLALGLLLLAFKSPAPNITNYPLVTGIKTTDWFFLSNPADATNRNTTLASVVANINTNGGLNSAAFGSPATLTNVNQQVVNGTPSTVLYPNAQAAETINNTNIIFNDSTATAALTISATAATLAGVPFSGSGSLLTALNATQLTSGSVPAARLTSVNGSGLTNLSAADGFQVVNSRSTLGSSAGMNNASVGWQTFVNGYAAGYNNGGDNAHIIVDMSTNWLDNCGWGQAVTITSGSSGSVVSGLTQGPTFSYIPRERTATFINSVSEIVQNTDDSLNQGFYICSPGGGHIAGDSGNYAYLGVDFKDGILGVPLIPSANGGSYKPSDVVYDFTVSGVTVSPTFVSGYVDSGGHPFTGFSNNISAGSGHFMATGSQGTNSGAGTLTKISGTGDASISYSTIGIARTWNGWGWQVAPGTGNETVWSNIFSTKGAITLLRSYVDNGTTNVNPFTTTTNIGFGLGNGDGMSVNITRGQEVLYLGQAGHPLMALTYNNWTAGPSVTIGTDQLSDDLNDGNGALNVQGNLALNTTNTSIGYTNTTQVDSTVFLAASGVQSNVLLRADSHSKGRIQIAKNTGTTNEIVAYPAGQGNIDGQTTFTNAPGGTLIVQSDGVTGQIIAYYGGAPTNIFTITATGWTNSTNWKEVAYVAGTAITLTNFNAAGLAVSTNTTLVNATLTLWLQPGAHFNAASGLSGQAQAVE